MIPHFVSSLIVQQKSLLSLCRHYVLREYQRIWGKFQFLVYGKDVIGQVVIWGKLESDKLGWGKLTWGKMTCNRFLDGINLR